MTITPQLPRGRRIFDGLSGSDGVREFKPGQSVLAPAIGGALGMETRASRAPASASLAISTAGNAEKAERARAAGYEHVIDLLESLKTGVLRITEGKGVDVIVDSVSGS